MQITIALRVTLAKNLIKKQLICLDFHKIPSTPIFLIPNPGLLCSTINRQEQSVQHDAKLLFPDIYLEYNFLV